MQLLCPGRLAVHTQPVHLHHACLSAVSHKCAQKHHMRLRHSAQSCLEAVHVTAQAAQESSSDDEDDDTPLAMLPASVLAAKRTIALSRKTPVSIGHQPPESPPGHNAAAASDSAKPPASPHVQVHPDSSAFVENNSGSLAEAAARQGSNKHDTVHAMPPEEALGTEIQMSSAGFSAASPEAAESVPLSAVSLGHDQEHSTAAEDAMTDEVQNALPDYKASMRHSPSSANHAQQQSGSRQQATTDAAAEDTMPAAKAADLISDSESEGQAGAASEDRSGPQHAAAPMQASPPSAISPAGTKPELASHVDDKQVQHVMLPKHQQPDMLASQAAPPYTTMPNPQASPKLAPQMTVLPSPPSSLHAPNEAAGGLLPGNVQLSQQHDMTGPLLSSTNELWGPASSPLHDSSESLLQAEAEAARLAQLMAPVVYGQPHQARQLAIAGQAPVKSTVGKAAGALQTKGDTAGAGEVLPEPTGILLADLSCAVKQDQVQSMAESSEAKGESAEVQTGTAVAKAAAAEKHGDGLQQLAMRLVQQQNVKSDQEHAPSSALPTAANKEAAQQIAVESQHNSNLLQIDACAVPVAAGILDAADLVIPDR